KVIAEVDREAEVAFVHGAHGGMRAETLVLPPVLTIALRSSPLHPHPVRRDLKRLLYRQPHGRLPALVLTLGFVLGPPPGPHHRVASVPVDHKGLVGDVVIVDPPAGDALPPGPL